MTKRSKMLPQMQQIRNALAGCPAFVLLARLPPRVCTSEARFKVVESESSLIT